jgi:hypothetical protein
VAIAAVCESLIHPSAALGGATPSRQEVA